MIIALSIIVVIVLVALACYAFFGVCDVAADMDHGTEREESSE